MRAGLATASVEQASALDRGRDALLRLQREDGSWEGECVWNSMLAAQYAITMHVVGHELSEERREGLLRQFRAMRNDRGVWGMHPWDDGSLFVTALVYVAARLLGVSSSASWLDDARAMFEREGVERIPTWGKAWLAVLGLYEWSGVQPILPEAWALPETLPVHPGNYYCHTRAIYLGLSVLYAERFVAPGGPLIDAIREELYGDRYASTDFAKAASDLLESDAPFPPGRALRAVYGLCRIYDEHHSARLRRRVLVKLRTRMRQHLRASDHRSLSPVNGLLIILALFQEDPADLDLLRAVARLDAWLWSDDGEGLRVAGAGSVCWDTSFALQALSACKGAAAGAAVESGAAFLASQQVERTGADPADPHRIDPRGGWCFSAVEHGWPVSDCTAEAVIALLEASPASLGREEAARGVRFMLRCQNRDGGFGSYEPAKSRFSLEWMNPAEMFGRCMTERSYVECTASCLMALAAVRGRFPGLLKNRIDIAIEAGKSFLLEAQRLDGTWVGAWGVHYIYGTMFGVRGLLAAGVPRSDERIRRACRWLTSHQRPDGGWGEDYQSIFAKRYVEARTGIPVQTAWALITLVEAGATDEEALGRAAAFLEATQASTGEWPDGAYVGVFFETALLNYRLYRQYFPVMALALHHRALEAEPEERGNADACHSNQRNA